MGKKCIRRENDLFEKAVLVEKRSLKSFICNISLFELNLKLIQITFYACRNRNKQDERAD